MKDTMRTASVLEIYTRAINELKDTRRKLQIDLQLLTGEDVVKRFIKIVIYGILGFLSLGIFSLVSLLDNRRGSPHGNDIAFVFMIGCLGLWGLITFVRYNQKKENTIQSNIQQLRESIADIDQQIQDKELRVKSLLIAEEVIVSKDLKIASMDSSVAQFSQDTINAELEKVCPMCAETIKKAARICRYCGHKFDLVEP